VWEDLLDKVSGNQDQIIAAALRIAAVTLGALLVSRLLRKLVNRIEGKVAEDTTPMRTLQRTATLTKVLSSAGIVVVWSVAGFLVLSELGFNLAPLLAGVGIVGLAVGFGAQNLVRDVVTGFFILLEDQYGVGDVIMINEVATGKVETLTLRVTGLRDLDGTMHYLSNGSISHVANKSKDWARAVVDIGVGRGAEPTQVRGVLERVAHEAKDDPILGRLLYAPPEVLGMESLTEYEVMWRIVADTKPGRQYDASRTLRERIKVAFDEANIEMPMPHRVMVSAGTGAEAGE
jgi:small-conductance mechanosensitive channel